MKKIKLSTNLSVLVIEDNIGDQILIEDYLNELILQPSLEYARSFREAKEILSERAEDIDVILLDLSLPDRDGNQLIVEILAICKELTGNYNLESAIQSLSMGVSDYLLKNEYNASSLCKSILYSIERKKLFLKLKESEKNHSAVFQYGPQPKWIVDIETLSFMDVNKASLELYNYEYDQFLSLGLKDIFTEKDYDKLLQSIHNSAYTFNGNYIGLYNCQSRSGKIIQSDIYVSKLQSGNKESLLIMAVNVTEKMEFEKTMSNAIIQTQEEERYEIGAELHDNICQLITLCKITSSMIAEPSDSKSQTYLKSTKEYLEVLYEETRLISHRLSPSFFKDSTMEEMMAQLITTLQRTTELDITFRCDDEIHNYSFNNSVILNFYRIIQEQFTNILKHAKAQKVSVAIFISNEMLVMEIADDGIGIEPSSLKDGIGLANMKRRVKLFSGNFEFNSTPGNGCKITVTIPITLRDLNFIREDNVTN